MESSFEYILKKIRSHEEDEEGMAVIKGPYTYDQIELAHDIAKAIFSKTELSMPYTHEPTGKYRIGDYLSNMHHLIMVLLMGEKSQLEDVMNLIRMRLILSGGKNYKKMWDVINKVPKDDNGNFSKEIVTEMGIKEGLNEKVIHEVIESLVKHNDIKMITKKMYKRLR